MLTYDLGKVCIIIFFYRTNIYIYIYMDSEFEGLSYEGTLFFQFFVKIYDNIRFFQIFVKTYDNIRFWAKFVL